MTANVQLHATGIEGLVLIEHPVHADQRGLFQETYHSRKYELAGLGVSFVQQNHSRSDYGTLRGLHYQLKHPQGKLISVLRGEVFDVAVDLRQDSTTFGQWYSTRLKQDTGRQLYVPPGLAHGFCTLSDAADLIYMCSDFYDPRDEYAVRWDDPDLNIPWPIADPRLSPRDATAPLFRDAPRF